MYALKSEGYFWLVRYVFNEAMYFLCEREENLHAQMRLRKAVL